ncbi:MAG: hypothetical protein HYZ22_03345, partial [Chloroflexi bacterium]|nr:hypothetical protein [Chloroflexota bacterium]
MKNKKYLLIICIALFAVLMSACAGAVSETPAQAADQQTVPGVEASLN